MKCEICPVDFTACGSQNNSGRNVRGTFQQYAVGNAKFVSLIPDSLPSELAAPLLCAGLSLYGAIADTNTKPGDWLALPGAGGGLGHLGLQIALRKGLKVIAIDSGAEKKAVCTELGATAFIDFKEEDVEAKVKSLTNGYGAHAVIVSVGVQAAYEQAVKLIRRKGTLVCVGLVSPPQPVPIASYQIVGGGYTIVGSSVGSEDEMKELLEMAARGEVVPRIQIYDFEEKTINEVLHKLHRSEFTGRAVLKLPQ